MIIVRFVIHDIKNSLKGGWWRYLAAVLVFSLMCLSLFASHRGEPSLWSIGDYIIAEHVGMKEYIPDSQDPFQFPAAWMLLQLLIAYATLYFPYNDMLGIGKHMMILSESRWKWWVAKCVWVILSVGLFYVLGLGVATLWAFGSTGEIAFYASEDLPNALMFKTALLQPYPWDLVPFLLTIPIVSTAICMVQLLFTLLAKPIASFIFTVSILFFSAYYLVPFFPGNYLMAARSNLFITNGVDPIAGGIASICMIAAVVMIGAFAIGRIDIMEKGRFE